MYLLGSRFCTCLVNDGGLKVSCFSDKGIVVVVVVVVFVVV